MKITSLKAQSRVDNRVNIYIDGKYSFSLTDYQVVELGLKVGQDYNEADIVKFKQESLLGKVYGKALNYCLIRPRSQKELADYLTRRSYKYKTVETDKLINKKTIEKLISKGYLDDEKFASWWVANRCLKKGISRRKLNLELKQKGLSSDIINQALQDSQRRDDEELQKIIEKVKKRYQDQAKLILYLQRQGFCYDDIVSALKGTN